MGAESIRTDPARQERWRSTSATALTSPGCALRLLGDLLGDGLDVRPHAVAVATERVLGEAGLVLRRQLVPDLRLHLVERRAVRRRLLHGRDEIDEVAAEERELSLRPHLAVPGDDVVEAELLELGQGFGPLGRVAVVHLVRGVVAGGGVVRRGGLCGDWLVLVGGRARRGRLGGPAHPPHAVVRHERRGVAVALAAGRGDGGVQDRKSTRLTMSAY